MDSRPVGRRQSPLDAGSFGVDVRVICRSLDMELVIDQLLDALGNLLEACNILRPEASSVVPGFASIGSLDERDCQFHHGIDVNVLSALSIDDDLPALQGRLLLVLYVNVFFRHFQYHP